MKQVVDVDVVGNIAVITVDNPPVNALSQSVRQGLFDAVEALERDSSTVAGVLICNGRTFIAGADITEFGKPPVEPFTPDLLLKIGACSKPIVAAMHGSVLGGGFETALACHVRVARFDTVVGFPEVTLGLIPGAGGTQLLPRLVGLNMSLDLITSGRKVRVDSEAGQKLVDVVVNESSSEALRTQAIDAARLAAQAGSVQRLSEATVTTDGDPAPLFADWRAKMAQKKRGVLAVSKCIESIENAVRLPFDDAIVEERRLFQECRQSSQSRALRHTFFAERSCLKIDDIDTAIQPIPVRTVGVIGAGWMGVGIATCLADAGIAVTLLDLNADMVEAGLQRILGNFEKSVARGRISKDELTARFSLVKVSTDYEDLGNVDLVIEAVVENKEVKAEIFRTLDRVCHERTVLATNTSYLDVNEIASVTDREERVIGLHFFSPAHIMKLLEIVRAAKTSDEVLVSMIALGKQLRKVPVTVGVCYGFAGNRIYARYGAEAQNLLLEGATPDQVDTAMRDWGMAMGPLQVVDLTGLDIGYLARQQQPNLPDDPTYFALSTVFVERGRLGQKSQAGFYRYEDGERIVDDEAVALIRKTASELAVPQRRFSSEEICQRLLSAIVDEGKAVLDEGIVQRASDIDVIWLNGYGFPRHRGGPMWFAEDSGLKTA
ncbi:MAG: 3-hydroxyacyl-CoA dehydrogenase NAD-binding domain-containing protein [Pseudomonadota bacterium]